MIWYSSNLPKLQSSIHKTTSPSQGRQPSYCLSSPTQSHHSPASQTSWPNPEAGGRVPHPVFSSFSSVWSPWSFLGHDSSWSEPSPWRRSVWFSEPGLEIKLLIAEVTYDPRNRCNPEAPACPEFLEFAVFLDKSRVQCNKYTQLELILLCSLLSINCFLLYNAT